MSTFTGGLASGIDTGALIKSLVAAASKPLTVIEDQRAATQDKKDAYDTLTSRLNALGTALQNLDTVSEFRSVTGTSADDSALGVTVGGDAVVGRFSVKVNALATASMSVSNGFSSRDAAGSFAQGTLGVTVGGVTTNVTIGSTETNLDDVVTAINDQVEGVTAYVMDTGDATNPYRLVITGNDTGASNAVSIDTSGLDASSGSVPTMTEVTAAADAELEVNGVTITSDSNQIDSAIQGVTFDAREVTTSAVTVSVGRDTESMVTKMQTVVTAYNSVISYINSQKVYNPDENIKGAFIGETQPTTVVQGLQSLIASQFTTTGSLTTLTSLGISTGKDGQISLDTDKLTDALNNHFEDAVSLFTTSTTGVAGKFDTLIDSYTGDDGSVVGRSESLSTQLDAADKRIADFNDYLAKYQARLEKSFTAMELAMSKFETAKAALLALMPDTTTSS